MRFAVLAAGVFDCKINWDSYRHDPFRRGHVCKLFLFWHSDSFWS